LGVRLHAIAVLPASFGKNCQIYLRFTKVRFSPDVSFTERWLNTGAPKAPAQWGTYPGACDHISHTHPHCAGFADDSSRRERCVSAQLVANPFSTMFTSHRLHSSVFATLAKPFSMQRLETLVRAAVCEPLHFSRRLETYRCTCAA
jgi:hypothetical protein